jgi:hypothetical protein
MLSRLSILLFLLPLCHFLNAQYDIGASGGIYEHRFFGCEIDAPAPQWSASMFYRERSADHADLAFELQLVNRHFFGEIAPGVQATEVMLQYLNLAAFIEVRLTESGDHVVRFGPVFGIKLAESFTGEIRTVTRDPQRPLIIEDLQNTRTDHFQNDQRILGGLGFRVPFGTRMAMVIDPYYTIGLGQLVNGNRTGRTDEAGIRVGFSRRFHQTGFTNWVSRSARRQREPVPPAPVIYKFKE